MHTDSPASSAPYTTRVTLGITFLLALLCPPAAAGDEGPKRGDGAEESGTRDEGPKRGDGAEESGTRDEDPRRADSAEEASPRERASDGAPDGEETVLEIVRFIESEDTADLWPGFRPSRIPLAFFDGDRTWLYGHPAPPETFRPHPAVDGLFRMDGRHSAMRGNTSTDVGGEETATILLPLLRDFPRVEDLAGVAIHEAFHVFQKERHPEWGPGGMGLDNPVTDERLLALRRTETTLLRQALGEADPERARARAVAALEVREERFSGLPPAIARFERGIELMEGTAQHVQVTATGSTAGLRDLPEEGFPAEALHMRSYAAGLAFTRLLERFRPNWEATVEARGDLPLDAVLAEATEGALAVDWTAVYAEELDEARRDVRRVQAARDSLRREFLERPGARLVLLAAEDAPLQLRGMDPMNLHMVGEGQVLHTRWLKLGHSTGSAEVLDGSALTFGVGGDPLGRGFHRVTVAGLEGEPTVRQEGREIVIRADGFQGRFRGAEVERVGEEIRIRLTPSPAPGEPSLSSSGFPCSGALPGPRAGGRSGRYARPGLRPPST